MMLHKFAVFACGDIGAAAVKMFEKHKECLQFVLLDKANFWGKNESILSVLQKFPDTEILYFDTVSDTLISKCGLVDIVILAWWGRLIKAPLLSAPRKGYINLHTSYLPYSKGKHPHFWSIVDEDEYGVTIMKIDSGLDTGPIIFQKKIPYTWEDTGKSLYFKGIEVMCALLNENKEKIINMDFDCEKQNLCEGTFHFAKEIEEVSKIELEKEYKAKDLINILRARTFPPFPGAYFIENGIKYEIRVDIKIKGDFDPQCLDYLSIRSMGEGD